MNEIPIKKEFIKYSLERFITYCQGTYTEWQKYFYVRKVKFVIKYYKVS